MRFRRLETRLLVSFLLLASLPLFLLALFAAGVTRTGLERISSPVIGDAFERAALLARETRDRLEFDAARLFPELPNRPAEGAEIDQVRKRLADAGFDFIAWEQPGGETRVVARTDVDDALGVPGVEDWAALADGRRPSSRAGESLRFFDGEPGTARALGRRLDPELAEALDASSRLYSSAQQLGSRFAPVLRTVAAAGLALMIAITGVAAYVLARRTARRVSRPVTELAAAADRLAGGDLQHRADIQADGEVAALVESFNRMGARLQASQARLVRAERVAAWRDAARRVAHEIKNPLTPIKLAVYRLRQRVGDDAATLGSLDSIGEEIENLARLADSFSEFAKLPAPSFDDVDLARLANQVVELHGGARESVQVGYVGPDALIVRGDRDLLRRALTNLVKNATQILADGGRVEVGLATDARGVRLTVDDDGPGVPEQIRESLGRPGVSARPGGSGLGLAMVQSIAEDHGGSLTWEDRHPGTRFTISLPPPPTGTAGADEPAPKA